MGKSNFVSMGPLYQQAGDNINLLAAPQRQLLPGNRAQEFGLAEGLSLRDGLRILPGPLHGSEEPSKKQK